MNCITSSLVWEKEYIIFDKEGYVATKHLNFFQRILRHIGFYAETEHHLRDREENDFVDFVENENDVLARVTYLFLAHIFNGTQELDEMKMASTGANGGALLAQKYGWKGPVNSFYKNGIGRPDELTLKKEDAQKLAQESLVEIDLSLNFLFSS